MTLCPLPLQAWACLAPPTTRAIVGFLLSGPVTAPCSRRVVGVIAAVLSWSAQRCGCRCASGCKSHCSPAHKNIVSILKKLNEKITHKCDQEVTSPGTISGLLISPPRPLSHPCCHLGPILVVAVIPVIAVPPEPLMLSWFPFPFCECSPFVHNHLVQFKKVKKKKYYLRSGGNPPESPCKALLVAVVVSAG
jgi:hypothetical protein